MTYDIVIGGGGFIGLTLARAHLSVAAPGQFRIAVVDPAPPERMRAPDTMDGR